MKHLKHKLLALLLGAALSPMALASGVEDRDSALASRMTELIKATVDGYFSQAGLVAPERVDVSAHGTYDERTKDPRLLSASLNVTMATDQQPAVIREARAQIARALVAQGFRFDTTEADGRPLAVLVVDAVPSSHLGNSGNGLREYATLFALAFGALFCLILAFYLLVRPFLRRRPLAVPEFVEGHDVAVHYTGPAVEDEPIDLPPVVAGAVDFKILSRSSREAVRRTFDQMPFDRAFSLLAATDPLTRKLLIDKLELNPPVRERLERELALTEAPI